MKFIPQNDSGLLEPIQKIGCFFRSCGLIAEINFQKQLTQKQINEGWLWAKENSHINQNNDIMRSAPIINYFAQILGGIGKFYEVGIFDKGKTTYYQVKPSLKKIDACIQKIRQNGPSKYHFRVVDKSGNVIGEPHEPAIICRGIEYTILYAYEE